MTRQHEYQEATEVACSRAGDTVVPPEGLCASAFESGELTRLPQDAAPDGLVASVLEVGGVLRVVFSYPTPKAAQIPGISGAESDVLVAAMDGLTNAEIARTRSCSARTVRNQLAAALRKLGFSSRSEAAAALRERTGPMSAATEKPAKHMSAALKVRSGSDG